MNKDIILIRKANIYTASMNGETVMMDADSGGYYNLGTVGGDIWCLLEKEMTLSELISSIVSEYDVSPDQCETDITPFLEQMIECGLIIEK